MTSDTNTNMFRRLLVAYSVAFATGNANNCGHLASQQFLQALPGHGWCNLRNKEMGQVLQLKYQNCETISDGFLIIPDNLDVTRVQKSTVQLFSDLFDSWSTYTSPTSRSINTNADMRISWFGISGSYSDDYQNCKTNQVNLKTVTTRVQARYTVFTVATPRSAEMNPHLKIRLEKVIDVIKSENSSTATADYLLELIVRDYGTHVITKVDAGGLIFQEDFLSRNYREKHSSETETIKATASARFLIKYGFGAQYNKSVNTRTANTYQENVKSSRMESYGGMLLLPHSQSIDNWVNSIPSNLASIDREGDPLYFIITPEAFPTENAEDLDTLRQRLHNTINQYYKYNKHVGCMKPSSKNFDYNSNIDDRLSCEEKTPFNNLTFGGVYQTCDYDSKDYAKHCMLHSNSQKNIFTQGYSCPPNYRSVLLMTSKKTVCKSCWFGKICCKEAITLKTYWCAASSTVAENTGVMFGGLYTSTVDNPTTQRRSCPPTYKAATLLDDLNICISSDYELGSRFKTDFGGFFSCQASNPLYDWTLLQPDGSAAIPKKPPPVSETAKTCPGGYTQHTAVIYQDCQVSYCVKAGSFSEFGELPIVLPPFQNYTGIFDHMKLVKAESASLSDGATNSVGLFIGIVVLGVLLIMALIGVAFVACLRRKNSNNHKKLIEGYNVPPENNLLGT